MVYGLQNIYLMYSMQNCNIFTDVLVEDVYENSYILQFLHLTLSAILITKTPLFSVINI